jgi:hypothetical protein
VLKPVLSRADELLCDRGQHPFPSGVTPHKLRHTFASILIALGRDPRHVMDELGRTDPKFTLRVYAHAMRFSEHESARLKAPVASTTVCNGGSSPPSSISRTRPGAPMPRRGSSPTARRGTCVAARQAPALVTAGCGVAVAVSRAARTETAPRPAGADAAPMGS